MALVNKVDFKTQVNLDVSIKYQILTYCFFNDVLISHTDLKFLCELAKNPGIELTKFCIYLTDKKIFKSQQSARNAINKIAGKGLVIKSGNNKKTIKIKPEMNVQVSGVVLLDYKVLGRESKEPQEV